MKLTTKEIATQIKSGEYPTERRDTTQFFNKLGDGVYVPDEDTRIQVRDTDRDIDYRFKAYRISISYQFH